MRLLEPGTLTLGACRVDALPMVSVAPDGSRTGYEPEVAAAIGRELGLAVRWTQLDWTGLYHALEAQHCDAILFNQAITPARQEKAAFTLPYGLFNDAVMVRRDSAVETIEQLRGKRVGAIEGTTNIAVAETFDGAQVVPFPEGLDGWDALLAALRAGDVDALVDDELVLRAFEPQGFRVAVVVETGNPFGIAVRKDATELKAALDRALVSLVESGELAALWGKWFPDSPFRLGAVVGRGEP